MIFTIYDSTGTNPVGVTVNNQMRVVTPTTLGQEGYMRISDAMGNVLALDGDGRVDAAVNTSLFTDNVEGTTVDPNKWAVGTTTMTVVQASGFITINNSNITTINTAAQIATTQYFEIMHEAWLYGHKQALITSLPAINFTAELGFCIASGITAPTDAAIFRWTPAGEFRCVLNNNGSETQISAALTAPSANVVHHFEVKLQHGEVEFHLDGVVIATLYPAAGVANAVNVGRVPWFARVVNGATAPLAAVQLKIAASDVWRTVLNTGVLYKDFQTSQGKGSWQNPSTFAQLANHVNSTSPASATLSNTAAGYPTLGGRWQFAAPASAATDFALFVYQVPTGWDLMIHDIAISAVNTGVAVGTTATIMDWFVATDSTAVSLATADALPTVVAPRRIPLGIQSWIVGAAVGAVAEDLQRSFTAALCCGGGRFFHVGVQVFLGTATAGQIPRGDVTFGGYFN